MTPDRHDGRAQPGFRFEANEATMNTAGGHVGSFNAGGDATYHIYQQNNRPICNEVTEWLRSQSLSYRKTHDDTYSARTPETGGWFFDYPQFKDWEEGRFGNLACIGMPGSGKTSLASAVIERLQKNVTLSHDMERKSPSRPRRPVLYIYCKNNSQSMQAIRIIFANLLSQIIENLNDEELSDEVLNLHKTYQSDKGMPRLDLTTDVLKKEISKYQRTYIILDALDEVTCVDHVELVEALEALGVQLFITCRWEVPFTSQTCIRIDDIQAKESDICTYINAQMQNNRIKKIIYKDPSLPTEIMSLLSAKARGMFLLPKLHMDMIKSQRTLQGIRDTMGRLPGNVHAFFEEALQRILDQPCQADIDIGMCTLNWMRYAKRFLTTDELLHALAMYLLPRDGGDHDLRGYLPWKEDVVAACAGLVVVVEPVEDRFEFQFTHYSIQEFLESSDRLPAYFGLSAQREITEGCLRYLIYTASSVRMDVHDRLVDITIAPGSNVAGNEYESYREAMVFDSYPLCRYAGLYWPDHAASIDEDFNHDLVMDLFRHPLSPYIHYDRYHSTYSPVTPLPFMSPEHYQILFLSRSDLPALLCMCLDSAAGNASSLDEIKDAGGWTVVHFAAQCGQLKILQILLNRGAKADIPDMYGDTPLCLASMEGHLDIVTLLLNKGAALNPPSPKETPLCEAAGAGNEELVLFLLSRGADINLLNHCTDKSSRTPLHAAMESRRLGIAKLLLSRGAKPNVPGINAGEPLALAAYQGNRELVLSLLEKGADPDIPDVSNMTPLHLCIREMHFDVAELLLAKGADPNQSGPYCGKPLALTAYHGVRELVQLLLEKGADPNQSDEDEMTPLYLCIQERHFDVAELLVAKGADPNPSGPYCGEPLALAAYHGERELVQLLLDKGADPNQPDVDDMTPLYLCIQERHFDVAELVLAKGADPNPSGPYCGEPLALAAYHGERELVQLLLDKGADPNQPDEDDMIPFYLCIQERHFDIAESLVAKGADPNPLGPYCGKPLALAAFHGQCELVQLLLDKGADPNRPDVDNSTPLLLCIWRRHFKLAELLLSRGAHPNPPGLCCGGPLAFAAYYGERELAQLLLDQGADPNQPDVEDRTPLYLCIRQRHFDVTQLLLAKGADPNPPGPYCGEPLALAARYVNQDLAQLLLERRADINRPNTEGETPLHLAIRENHPGVVKLFLNRGAKCKDEEEMMAAKRLASSSMPTCGCGRIIAPPPDWLAESNLGFTVSCSTNNTEPASLNALQNVGDSIQEELNPEPKRDGTTDNRDYVSVSAAMGEITTQESPFCPERLGSENMGHASAKHLRCRKCTLGLKTSNFIYIPAWLSRGLTYCT